MNAKTAAIAAAAFFFNRSIHAARAAFFSASIFRENSQRK